MLDASVTVDDKSRSFETPIKYNQSDTAPSVQVLLGYDTMKCQHNIITCMTIQKLPPSGKEYLCFQTDVRTSQTAHCSKPMLLTKFIDTILYI